jgi:hypothetical protein
MPLSPRRLPARLLATIGYLIPSLPRLLRPLLTRQGRAAKRRYVTARKDHAVR